MTTTAKQQAKHTPGRFYCGMCACNFEAPVSPNCPSCGSDETESWAAFRQDVATKAERDRLKALNAELLAALKAIQASFMQDGRLLEGGEWLESDLTQAAFDGMRSAIAKCEGR